MTTYQYTTPPYLTGQAVTVQPLQLGVAVGSPISATALAADSSAYGVNLTGIGPVDTLWWIAGGAKFAVSSINWNGTAEVSNVALAADIEEASPPTVSQIAAVILKTPANLIETNADGSVNTDGNIVVDNYIVVMPAVAANSQKPAQITIVTGDSFANALPLLGTLTGWTKLIFAIKSSPNDADSASIVEVVLNSSGGGNGLLTLNGASASDATQGSLSVANASTGAVNVVLSAATTAALNPANKTWAIKVITPSAEWSIPGQAAITPGVIKAVS